MKNVAAAHSVDTGQAPTLAGPRITRPVLGYPGGKFVLRRWIISHFGPHRLYTESYGGAGSVLLSKPRAYGEIYNDLDKSCWRLFRVLRSPQLSAELRRQLELTPFSRLEYELAASLDLEQLDDDVEAARLLVIRSFQGQGGDSVMGTSSGFRRKGFGSNRSAPASWAAYPPALAAVTARLEGVLIEHRPAADVLVHYDAEDTLHYVDPPYLTSTRGRKRALYKHELDDAGHRQLAKVLRELLGCVVLSGYPSALYDEELYPDWHRDECRTHADRAAFRVEVLWSNRPFPQGRLPLGVP